jgi:DNA-binding NarL/FixJ family response regulator
MLCAGSGPNLLASARNRMIRGLSKPCAFKLWAPRKCRLVRILVVDDNPAVRHYLRALLEQQTAWQVCAEARTGREALQWVEKNPPDMILLDFQMPDLNGLDVAREIARLFPKIPILMVTIHLSRQLAEEARKVGIRGACAKSDVGSIVEAVDALLHEGTYFPAMSLLDN